MNWKRVLRLWNTARTPMNVRVHCVMVSKVAEYLCKIANERTFPVDCDVVVESALLHDTYRAINFTTIEAERLMDFEKGNIPFWEKQIRELSTYDHAEYMAQILEKEGLSDYARIIRKHEITSVDAPETYPSLLDEQIVFIADKHVTHGEIVKFDERIEESKKRHGWSPEEIKTLEKTWDNVRMLEKELFSKLSISIEDLLANNQHVKIDINLLR